VPQRRAARSARNRARPREREDEARRLVADQTQPAEKRRAALQAVIDNRPDDLRAFCEQQLADRAINVVAVRMP